MVGNIYVSILIDVTRFLESVTLIGNTVAVNVIQRAGEDVTRIRDGVRVAIRVARVENAVVVTVRCSRGELTRVERSFQVAVEAEIVRNLTNIKDPVAVAVQARVGRDLTRIGPAISVAVDTGIIGEFTRVQLTIGVSVGSRSRGEFTRVRKTVRVAVDTAAEITTNRRTAPVDNTHRRHVHG